MFRRATFALVVCLGVGALAGCPSSDPPARPRPARPPSAQVALPHAWPPRKGEPFPALELLDREGNSVQLASLAGKVLLIEPVGISCPGCQAFSGGAVVGGFRGCEPQAGLAPMEQRFLARGIDPAHADFAVVQLLFYDMSAAAAPTVADARDWAAHFGFDQLSNVHVLVGDERYVRQETYDLIPGFFLVDRDGKVVGDATGHEPQESYDALFDTLAALLGAGSPKAPFVVPADPFAAFPELAERAERGRCRADLHARRWEELEERLTALRAAGRRPGDFELLLDHAVGQLAYGVDSSAVAPTFDAWCEERPGSALAFLARGDFLIDYAWEARGSGYANTVSEEGWQLFGRRLTLARRDLERAATLDPTLAPAYARLITVAMGLSLDAAAGRAYFDKAVEVDPTYVDAYQRQLKSIMPKWGGDEETMWAFVKDSLAAHPDEPALLHLLNEATFEQGRLAGGHRAHLQKAEVRKALDAAHQAVVTAYPRAVNAWITREQVVAARKDQAQLRQAVLMQAETGSGPSQLEAAKALYYGAGGYRRDLPKAVEYALRAAYHDIVDAMLLLALMLRDGHGVAKDLVASNGWLRGAARLGDESAMNLLGEHLGPEVRGEAIAWVRRASASEDPEVARVAQAHLARLEAER